MELSDEPERVIPQGSGDERNVIRRQVRRIAKEQLRPWSHDKGMRSQLIFAKAEFKLSKV